MSTPKKGVAYDFSTGLGDSTDAGKFVINPTIAAGDFQVSKDGGTFANLATLPVVTPSGSRAVKVSLSATEMNADKVVVIAVDAAGAEWTEVFVFIDAPVSNVDDILKTSDLAAALVAIHLDHIFAVDYDPASIPGVAGAWMNEAVEDDTQGAFRFTAKMVENVVSSGGGFITSQWRWSTDTGATDPGTGRVKGNNAVLANITQFFIHEITTTSQNASAVIEALDSGDTFLIAREGAGDNFVNFLVSGPPTDNGVFYTIPGTVTDSAGSFGNNNTMDVTFAFKSDSAVVIAQQVWAELRAANLVVDSFGEGFTTILTDLAAVKAKTDDMVFTVANQLDVNTLGWAGTTVTISGTTALPEVDVKSISDDATAANNLELDYDGTGFAKANSTLGTVTLVDTTTVNSDMRGTDDGALALVATEARLAELDPANLPSDVDDVLADTNQLQRLAEADVFIDTATTPWDIVLILKGTGGIGTGTELLRKELFDTAGVNITSTDDVIGRQVEP